MLAEIAPEFFIQQRLDDTFDLAVTEFGLCLSLELRLGHFHTDHRGQPLANVFALEILFVLF